MRRSKARLSARWRRMAAAPCALALSLMCAAATLPADDDERARRKCYCLFLDAEHKREYCERYQKESNDLCYRRCLCDKAYDRKEQRKMNKQEYQGAWRDACSCCTGCWEPLAGMLTLVALILLNPHF